MRQLDERIAQLDAGPASTAPVDGAALLSLAHDLDIDLGAAVEAEEELAL